jgi:hypothetical protein
MFFFFLVVLIFDYNLVGWLVSTIPTNQLESSILRKNSFKIFDFKSLKTKWIIKSLKEDERLK